MRPGEAINLVEVVLRDLVRLILGAQWATVGNLTDEEKARLEEKLRTEKGRRRGSRVSEDLLDYTDFSWLSRLILNEFSLFGPALGGRKKYMEVYFGRLDAFRNPAMHSRDLLPFEEALVLGITGELRNMITLYRSQMGPDSKHYPVVDLITDNFGNTVTQANDHSVLRTGLRLNVGDVVTFDCKGTDPQGRKLMWSVELFRIHSTAEGDEVRLTWQVTEDDVGERVIQHLTLTSDGRFHRHGTRDSEIMIEYAVNPPDRLDDACTPK